MLPDIVGNSHDQDPAFSLCEHLKKKVSNILYRKKKEKCDERMNCIFMSFWGWHICWSMSQLSCIYFINIKSLEIIGK